VNHNEDARSLSLLSEQYRRHNALAGARIAITGGTSQDFSLVDVGFRQIDFLFDLHFRNRDSLARCRRLG